MKLKSYVLPEFLTEHTTCLKKHLQEKNHQEEKLIFGNQWSKNGE
jgi:hypothetical protein